MNIRKLLIATALTELCAGHAMATSHFELCEDWAAKIADPAKAQSFLQSCKADPKEKAWRKSLAPVSEFNQVRYKCLLESKFSQPVAGREYFHTLFMACMGAHGYVYTEVD